MFVVQTLNVLHGPNLFHALSGVRLKIHWPDGFGQSERFASSLALDFLNQCKLLPPHFKVGNVGDRMPVRIDGPSGLVAIAVQLTLDFLTSQTGAPDGYVVATQDPFVGVHHCDGNLAAIAAQAGLTVATLALRMAKSPAPAIADLSAIESTLNDAQKLCSTVAIGETGWHKVRAAQRRDIPWRRLVSSERVLQYGYGHRQTRIRDSLIESDGQIAIVLATHKHLASQLLRNNGLPVPMNALAIDHSSAIRAARSLGFPVVVKPNTTDFGTAVSVNLRSDAAVVAAFDRARQFGPVLIEKHLPGNNCRLLVMHGRFLSAVQQDPAHVVGDGGLSIEQLVQKANRGRSSGLSERLKKITLDDDVLRILASQGLTLAAVPAAGQRVNLREHSNLSVGGSFENINTILHSDNKMLAERAAEIVGLKVAGIDFITTDPSRSYLESGGAICEINPTPGFVMGEAEFNIEDAFLDGLFPNDSNGRIPLVAVLSDGPIGELVKRLEAIAQSAGHTVYVATPENLRYEGHCIAKGHMTQTLGTGAALQHRSATAAIVQLTRTGTAEEGLVFDRCNLAIVADTPTAAFASETNRSDPVAALLASHASRVVYGSDATVIEAAARELFQSTPQPSQIDH